MTTKDKLFAETILAMPHFAHLCMAEGDEGAAPGGSEGAEAPGGEAAEEELDLAEETPESDDAEEAELEIGPQKLKVPKVVKEAWDGLQRNVQTEKEATKAEKAAAAAERERAQTYVKTIQAITDEVGEIRSIDKQTEAYSKLTPADWMAWAQQDPKAAGEAQIAFTALQQRRSQLVQAAEQKAKGIQEQEAKTITERRTKAEAEIAAKIKDWPAKKDAIVNMIKAEGFGDADVQALMMMPAAVGIAHEAMLYRAAKARAAAKSAAPKNDEPPPQPAPRVRTGGTSRANDLSDRTPIDEWTKNFRKLMSS